MILGGGFGGLFAARALDGASVRVTLLDRHNYHLFQPLLYQVATAALSPGDVASPIRWVLRRQKNVTVLLADVHRIDAARRRVVLNAPASVNDGADGVEQALAYDFLIVATGAAHAYFGHAEWAASAPGLKTLDDAQEMRRQVLLAFEAAERETDDVRRRRLLTFVLIGAGPTGVELAGALAEIARQSLKKDFRNIRPESARVVLLEGGPDVLGTFPESLRRKARTSLERLGVEVRTGAVVTGVDVDGVTFAVTSAASHDTASGVAGATEHRTDRISAQTVIWAAGVAASPVVASIGVTLDKAGRVLAEPTLAVPGYPEVFVVGDVCALRQDGRALPGVAQVAMQGGSHAARSILRAIRQQSPQAFRYRDYGNMAVIGRAAAVADLGPIKMSGFLAWLMWLFLHVFWLIGFRSRLAVMSEWGWAYLTMQRRVRLITGERLWPRG